jgi:hypothetical protein
VQLTLQGDYLVETEGGLSSRFLPEEVRGWKPSRFRDYDDKSFTSILSVVPLQGEVTLGEPAPFVRPLLAHTPFPLTMQDRISTRVIRIQDDTAFIDIAYTTGSPPKGQESGFREITELTGSLELSLSTGRPIRLDFKSSGVEWVYRFGGRIEPWDITDDVHCEWTYPRDPTVHAP